MIATFAIITATSYTFIFKITLISLDFLAKQAILGIIAFIGHTTLLISSTVLIIVTAMTLLFIIHFFIILKPR